MYQAACVAGVILLFLDTSIHRVCRDLSTWAKSTGSWATADVVLTGRLGEHLAAAAAASGAGTGQHRAADDAAASAHATPRVAADGVTPIPAPVSSEAAAAAAAAALEQVITAKGFQIVRCGLALSGVRFVGAGWRTVSSMRCCRVHVL